MDLKAYLNEKRAIVDDALEAYLPDSDGLAEDVVKAMRYSLFAGGKRLRPILCMAGAGAVGGEERETLPIACALEMIHTYSLIHDDLPMMDDDDTRRGKPTNHRIFGEAVALLAGDGLLTEAFHLMTNKGLNGGVNPRALLRVIALVAEAAGHRGMVGGQTADIQSEGKEVDSSVLEFIHTHKTARLIAASVSSGTILCGANGAQERAMRTYGHNIGLAFQIADDILNIEGDATAMGKAVGSDAEKGKITYPSLIGLSQAKEIGKGMVEEAIRALAAFDHRADPLRHIARYIIERKK